MNGSKEVLRQGLRLAHDERCWVTVVKVMPPYEGDLELVGIRNIEALLDSNEGITVAELKDLAREERAMIRTRIEEGDIPRKIVEVAGEERCDIIIMGAERRKGLRRFFGGGVVSRVINQAPCPVLVVEA